MKTIANNGRRFFVPGDDSNLFSGAWQYTQIPELSLIGLRQLGQRASTARGYHLSTELPLRLKKASSGVFALESCCKVSSFKTWATLRKNSRCSLVDSFPETKTNQKNVSSSRC